MNNCIKTGARVHFYEYGMTVAADLFSVGDSLVVNFNPQSAVFEKTPEATHEVFLGQRGFLHKEKGVAVVPAGCVEVLK